MMEVPPETATTEIWHLRLYVAGASARSLRAFSNLKMMCEEHLHGRYEIEVIDLAEDPSLAAIDDIVALPTLIRRLPAPLRRVIGDLSNTERVLVSLHVETAADDPLDSGRDDSRPRR